MKTEKCSVCGEVNLSSMIGIDGRCRKCLSSNIMKCERCKTETDEIVETDRGIFLCYGCDSERLSCINNPDNPKTEEDFWKEIK
jgi:hypothetical protein